MEESYESFAGVYDSLMDNVPYRKWAAYTEELLREYGIKDGIICDLGCGTGSLTELLAKDGYDMIGIDLSDRMLQEAMEKRAESGLDILYLQQDMRELELFGTVRAVISVCDSLNYLTDPADLAETFRLVDNYLDPGGLFLFDMNTIYKYETVIGDSTIAETREDCAFIWENSYDAENRVNIYDLTLFLRHEDGSYQRSQETHYQRGYTEEEIRAALEAAGLKLLHIYDAFTRQPVRPDSERITVLACEQKKSWDDLERFMKGVPAEEDKDE